MFKIKNLLYILLIVALLSACAPEAAPVAEAPAEAQAEEPAEEPEAEEKQLTYCHITPGPDTWYKRVAEGFEFGGSLDGVDIIVVNSDYDVEKELQNIEYCVNQGVDGILVFSFNENGARLAAKAGQDAGIPVVAADSVGSVQEAGQEIVAEVDFDWTEMGEVTATWMAENHPGKDFVHITGNFTSVPMIKINEAILNKSEELGKNKRLDIREGKFNPEVALAAAEDLLQSGLDFEIFYVADEDTGASVMRMLKDKDLLNNPYIVVSENGSPVGIELIKSGDLAFTISSSPGWEGYIAYLALHNYVVGASDEINQHIFLPTIAISEENIDDPMVVVPWEVTPDVFELLTENYFTELLAYRNQ
ncbi:MAG TPA: sugar ABC transporter substrate-binding protein [Anaerolineae bacterium]|nr:sugar ABC transporter substrate-binding protein [Anaerolineae bacterium]